MELSVYLRSTIILYKHNSDETFWWRRNVNSHHGPATSLPLSWTITSRLTKKQFTLIETLFWGSYKEKCWQSLWTIADGHSVVGSGYWQHNIYDEKNLFWYIAIEVKDWWFYMGYSPPDYLYMNMFIDFFVAIEVKDSGVFCLYEL